MANGIDTWVWIAFSVFIIVALGLDTFLVNKEHGKPTSPIRTALIWSTVWVVCALIFNVLLWIYFYHNATIEIANEKALNFLTGYLIEKTLSFDNLFAFYIVFHHFNIPVQYQHRVFSYGIWSAIVFRLLLILFGTWLVKEVHWSLYVMGVFLLLTGIKMFVVKEHEKDLAENWSIRLAKRFFNITPELHQEHFFIRKAGVLYATPLLVALFFIEISDLIFAFDSIPAIFAITTDPFIVWSSNIFAILGLRALYFLLAGMVHRFHLLRYGIALILVFVGLKMLIAPWLHISAVLSLVIVFCLIVFFILLSLVVTRKQGNEHAGH